MGNIKFYMILITVFLLDSVIRKRHTDHTLYQSSIDTKAFAATALILRITEDMGLTSDHENRFKNLYNSNIRISHVM